MADGNADQPRQDSAGDGSAPSPFMDWLGVCNAEASNGWAKLELAVEEWHQRSMGMLHGGVMASLLDSAMGMAAYSLAPEDRMVVTVQLSVNFIRAPKAGDHLSAVGEIIHSGQQTAVGRGQVHMLDGRLAGSGTATFLYLPRPLVVP